MDQSLRSHFRKGAPHWNNFIDTYDGERIDFSGGVFKSERLDLSGYRFPLPISFSDCEFKGVVQIDRCTFEAWVSFESATFQQGISIANSEFNGDVDFESARFKDALIIKECAFVCDAKLEDVDVLGRMHVSECTFDGDVYLTEVGAYGGLILSNSTFKKEVSFSGQFEKETLLFGNQFEGYVDFGYAHFKAPLVLRGNEFAVRPMIDNIRLERFPPDLSQFVCRGIPQPQQIRFGLR